MDEKRLSKPMTIAKPVSHSMRFMLRRLRSTCNRYAYFIHLALHSIADPCAPVQYSAGAGRTRQQGYAVGAPAAGRQGRGAGRTAPVLRSSVRRTAQQSPDAHEWAAGAAERFPGAGGLLAFKRVRASAENRDDPHDLRR